MAQLKGYRTYIIAALAVAAVAANYVGVINDEALKSILGALGAGGMITLRLALTNLTNGK